MLEVVEVAGKPLTDIVLGLLVSGLAGLLGGFVFFGAFTFWYCIFGISVCETENEHWVDHQVASQLGNRPGEVLTGLVAVDFVVACKGYLGEHEHVKTTVTEDSLGQELYIGH